MKASALKAVDDYKKSVAFDEKVTEVSAYRYEYGFNNCKAKVTELFLELDLNRVVIEEATKEEIREENVEKALAKEVAPSSLEKGLAKEVYPTQRRSLKPCTFIL